MPTNTRASAADNDRGPGQAGCFRFSRRETILAATTMAKPTSLRSDEHPEQEATVSAPVIRFRWPPGSGAAGWHRVRTKPPSECRTKKQAEGWGEREQARLLAAGPPKAPGLMPAAVPTLAEFAPEWLDKHVVGNLRKRSTYVTAKMILDLHLLPIIGGKSLDAIDDETIAALRAKWLRGGYATHGAKGRPVKATRSQKTINNRLSILSTVLHVAKKWKRIAAMPCAIELLKVDDQREAPFYEHDTYERIVDAARDLDPRIYAAVLLAGDAGLRRGEIIALAPADLDVKGDKPRITVRHHVFIEKGGRETVAAVKGGKARAIPCTPRLADALRALNANGHGAGERVIRADEGRTTPKVLKLWVMRAERAAGLPETGRIHVYRHTFASHLAMAAVPARTIQELARHASLMTTARYMHLSPNAKDEGIAALDRSRQARLGKSVASLDAEEQKA